jgi:hypothetical protein
MSYTHAHACGLVAGADSKSHAGELFAAVVGRRVLVVSMCMYVFMCVYMHVCMQVCMYVGM